jgi:hypothetical protein
VDHAHRPGPTATATRRASHRPRQAAALPLRARTLSGSPSLADPMIGRIRDQRESDFRDIRADIARRSVDGHHKQQTRRSAFRRDANAHSDRPGPPNIR